MSDFKKELDGTIYVSAEDITTYVTLREQGMAEVGAIEVLNSFAPEQMNTIRNFVRLYMHYFG